MEHRPVKKYGKVSVRKILTIVHFFGGLDLLSTRGRPAIDPRKSCGEVAAGEILKIVLFWEGPADVGSEVKVDRRASGFYKIHSRARTYYILGKVPVRRSTGPPPCEIREAV